MKPMKMTPMRAMTPMKPMKKTPAILALSLLLGILLGLPLSALGDREGPSGSERQSRIVEQSRTANGAAEESATAAPPEVTDDTGRVVKLDAYPLRIVSGTLFTDEILVSLGLGGRIAAVTSFAEDPAISNIAADLPRGLPRIPFSVEIYLSLRPDLVLLADWSDPAGVRQLREAGIPVFLARSPRSFEEITALLRTIAELAGVRARGEALASSMQKKLDAVRRQVEDVPPEKRPRVADLTPSGVSLGTGSSWDAIIRAAGCVNAFAELSGDQWGSVQVSTELLITLDPDILVIPDWFYGEPAGYADTFYRQVMNDPALQGLSAVREGRVVRIPERHRLSTSHYMVLGVEDLARAAWPDRFDPEKDGSR